MALEGYLEERLAQMVVEREEVLVRLEEIRSKMKRADTKRSGEANTPNYKKWSSILRGLENEHDKHKAMITTLEAETQEKTARLTQIRTDRESHQSKLKENFDRIMALPPEEMAALTPEDLELLQEYELQIEAAEKAAEPAAPEEEAAKQKATQYVQVTEFRSSKEEPAPPQHIQVTEFLPSEKAPLTRPPIQVTKFQPAPKEPAPTPKTPSAPVETAVIAQTPEAPTVQPAASHKKTAEPDAAPQQSTDAPTPIPATESAPSPIQTSSPLAGMDAKTRRKYAFKSALDKSREGAITELTFEEVAVMLTAYRKLASQASDSPAAAALEENVSGAMWEVHAHCARICANWGDLMRREADTRK